MDKCIFSKTFPLRWRRNKLSFVLTSVAFRRRWWEYCFSMGKRTRKVGIVGKYGTRYGASIRKSIKKIEIAQHAKYTCAFCGKDSIKRKVLLRSGLDKCLKWVLGGWHLALQILQQNYSGRRMVTKYTGCSNCTKHDSSPSGTDGVLRWEASTCGRLLFASLRRNLDSLSNKNKAKKTVVRMS